MGNEIVKPAGNNLKTKTVFVDTEMDESLGAKMVLAQRLLRSLLMAASISIILWIIERQIEARGDI